MFKSTLILTLVFLSIGFSSDCKVEIIKNKNYIPTDSLIDSEHLPTEEQGMRCSAYYAKKWIRKKACEIGATTAHIKNIKPLIESKNGCFEADVYFYTHSNNKAMDGVNRRFPIRRTRKPKWKLKEERIFSNEGLRLEVGFGPSFVKSGNQTKHGIFYYSESDTTGSREVQVDLNFAAGYFLTKGAGLFVGYERAFTEAAPEQTGPTNVKLYDKHALLFYPKIVFFNHVIKKVALNIYGMGGMSLNWLKYKQEYKDIAHKRLDEDFGEGMVRLSNDFAHGIGWFGGMGTEVMFKTGFVAGSHITYKVESPKFSGAEEPIDGKFVDLNLYIGYRFRL